MKQQITAPPQILSHEGETRERHSIGHNPDLVNIMVWFVPSSIFPPTGLFMGLFFQHLERKVRCCLLLEALPDCFQEALGRSFLHLVQPAWHHMVTLWHWAEQRVLTLCLLVVWPWGSYLTSLCIGFSSCKMGLIAGTSCLACREGEMNWMCNVLRIGPSTKCSFNI